MRQVEEVVRVKMSEERLGGGESMRRKQKEGRQGKTVLPQGASSHPSEGWVVS